MNAALAALIAALAALAAGTLIWFARGREVMAAKHALESGRIETEALRKTAADAREEAASLRGKHAADETHHKEQMEELTRLKGEIETKFKVLADEALAGSNAEFIKRAKEIFELQKAGTAAEIDKRTKTIDDIVKPLGERLAAYETMVKDIEKARTESYGSLTSTLKTVAAQNEEVKTVTANLVNTLKKSPKARGRWGEEALRRVAELSGMSEHCDFDTEYFVRIPDENRRPDMVIHVAGGREIVVDAKAPLSAYLAAIEATDDAERERLLKQHAKELRERMQNLADKKYWELFQGAVDSVVMFVPGDNFVSAAFEYDQSLFDDALKNHVLVCTPTTFIALMKAISYGWGQERLAENAREVGTLGKELYARLCKLGEHVDKLGRNLDTAVRTYNAMVGSLENSVLPQARRFNELGVEGTTAALPEMHDVETAPRLPQEGRDLQLPPPGSQS